MSSVPESLTAGSTLLHYTMIDRLAGATNVWRAEDARAGKQVAVKILTRIVPKDKAQRDNLLRETRLAAAVRHPGLVQILNIDIDKEALFMAMELVDGEPLSKRVARGSTGRNEFLKLTHQMAETLSYLHSRSLVHGALTADAWIITPVGDLKLTGLGYACFRERHETGQKLLSAFKQSDVRAAAYLAPEQVSGKPVDSRTDIFSLGVTMYELAAAKPPFSGATVAELAQAIVQSAPPAPMNQQIDKQLLMVMGRCIQKNPEKRYAKVDELIADLRKLEPGIDRLSTRRVVVAAVPPSPVAPQVAAAPAFIFVAELPYHDLLRKKDPERAARLEGKLQQYLGEAAYLFDGKVLDSLGPRMVAEMPSAQSALQAAERGLAELLELNASNPAEAVEPRMVVHYGELIAAEGKPGGAGLEIADAVLDSMEPLQLLISEPIVAALAPSSPPKPVGKFRDFNFYAPPPPEPKAAPPVPAPAPTAPAATKVASKAASKAPAAAPVEQAAELSGEAEEAAPAPARKSKVVPLAIAAILLLAVIGIAAFFVRQRMSAPPPAPVQAAAPAPQPAPPTDTAPKINPKEIYLAEIAVDMSPVADVTQTAAVTTASVPPDPKLTQAAGIIRETTSKILGMEGSLSFVDAASPTSRKLGGAISKSAGGNVLIPSLTEGTAKVEGDPIPLSDPVGAGIQYAKWSADRLGLDSTRFLSMNLAAMKGYLDAMALKGAGNDDKSLAVLRKVVAADGNFLAAQQVTFDLLMAKGLGDEAVGVAEKIAALDPQNLEIRKRLAEWQIQRGRPASAIAYMAELLKAKPDDAEILTALGNYSLCVGDEARFTAIVNKLQSLGVKDMSLHTPDILVANGRIDAAVKKYYEVETSDQQNARLALKIGRLAVIRRSDSVIAFEVEKLQKLGDPYALAMLEAYVAAGNGKAAEADAKFAAAVAVAKKGDAVNTANAEINVLLNRQRKVAEALDKAVAQSEPTLIYIESNPLFSYLGNDPAFRKLRLKIDQQKSEIATALQSVQI